MTGGENGKDSDRMESGSAANAWESPGPHFPIYNIGAGASAHSG